MTATIKALLTSKKATMTIAGVVIALAAKHGFNLDSASVEWIVRLFMAYIVGQGMADFGKEAK